MTDEVTADTITDEQIRELRLELARVLDDEDTRSARRGDWDRAYADFSACDTALAPPQSAVAKRYRVSRRDRRKARARCAEILNERKRRGH